MVTLTFSLYALQQGGSPLWSETQSASLDTQGNYVVLLGATQPAGLPQDLFSSGQALWLGVQPQLSAVGELPRVLLVAVPYALKASDSDTLGGKPASAYALAGSPILGGAGRWGRVPDPATPGSKPDAAAGSSSSPQPLVTACSAVTSDGTRPPIRWPNSPPPAMWRIPCSGIMVPAWRWGARARPAPCWMCNLPPPPPPGPCKGSECSPRSIPPPPLPPPPLGFFYATTASGNTQNFTGSVFASRFYLDHYGKGTLTNGYGVNGTVVNRAIGTINNAYGFYANMSNASTGKINNGFGVYVAAPSNATGGTFSNYTGLYIGNPTAVTGAYGLYSAGGKNYFGGNVGIGTSAPGANLEVNGTAKFDGLVTFKAGQTFPGAGTVSSVASGPGLTGGPITSSGTLSIATAGVADTMLANAYSGVGTCAAGQVVTALARNGAPTCLTANIGTVTGVLPGTDMLGGGTSGMVTLNLDTTKVPQLATPNTFATTQTISSGDLVLGGGDIDLPQTASPASGVVNLGGNPFMHACCPNSTQNTFVGSNAGNLGADVGTTGGGATRRWVSRLSRHCRRETPTRPRGRAPSSRTPSGVTTPPRGLMPSSTTTPGVTTPPWGRMPSTSTRAATSTPPWAFTPA